MPIRQRGIPPLEVVRRTECICSYTGLATSTNIMASTLRRHPILLESKSYNFDEVKYEEVPDRMRIRLDSLHLA